MSLIRQSDGRDLRVDFFRGLALWWIYTDHIPGDVLGSLSLRNVAVNDATEVFVLLAGYGAGLAYGMSMWRNGYVSAAADVLKRAWVLYVAHIFLFVLYTAQVTYLATVLNRGHYLDETNLAALGTDPYGGLLQAMLLRFQPSLLNILPLYVVLLVFFAGTMWLLRWPRVLFGLSLGLYLLVRATGWNFGAWNGDNWFFDPFAWQFLFVIGILLACAPMRAPGRPRWLDGMATAVLVAGAVVSLFVLPYPNRVTLVSHSLLWPLVVQDKTLLYPFRVFSILAMTWLCVRLIPIGAVWLRSRWAAPLVLMGQNSLPVFCSGILLGFAARLGLEYDNSTWMQAAVNAFGAVGLVGVGAIVAWYRIKGRKRAPRSAARPQLSLGTAAPTPGE